MTITRKPASPSKPASLAAAPAPTTKPRAKPKAAKKVEKAADAFIQAADHAPPVTKPRRVKPPAEKVAAALPAEEAVSKGKPKAKDKAKAKGKDKKKKKNKNKEAVIIRFENDQLKQIDSASEALGLSRAAWVRMIVAKALPVNL